MAGRHTSLIIAASLLLTVVGAFVVNEVQAQRACTVADDAPVAEHTTACGSGLRCLTGRCNLPPPIWNAQVLGGVQTGAFFDVEQDSRVRGDLTVGTGFIIPATAPAGSLLVAGDLFANAIFSRPTALAVNQLWIGDGDDVVRIQGDLRFGPDTVAQCTAGQVWKRNAAGTAWVCADDIVGGAGAGGGGGGAGGGGAVDLCTVNLVRGTSAGSNGSAGGYGGANAQCPATQHVCTAEGVLHTLNCLRTNPATVIPADDTTGWISGGPPGDIAPANDCNGWTSDAGTVLGRVWTFTNAGEFEGGFGSLRNCDSTLPFLCCS